MGNSFVRERRGISWKDRTLASVTAPPIPLMVIFGLVVLLMCLATYSDYKAQAERTVIGFKLLLFLSPVLIILMVHLMIVSNRWFYYVRGSRPVSESINQEGSSPWGLVLVVLLLLVLVYYHSSIQSTWFRTL